MMKSKIFYFTKLFILLTCFILILSGCDTINIKKGSESVTMTSSSVDSDTNSRNESEESRTLLSKEKGVSSLATDEGESSGNIPQLSLSALINKDEKEYTWSIEKVKLYDSVTYEYPIVHMEEKSLEDSVNSLIYQMATDDETLRWIQEETQESATYSKTCMIIIDTASLLSLRFDSLYWGGDSAAHPWNQTDTLNINMLTGEKIFLRDVFRINNEFAFSAITEEQSLTQDRDVLERYIPLSVLEKRNTKEVNIFIQQLLSADEGDNCQTYYTGEKLGLVFPVSHVEGSVLIFEAPYDKLSRFTVDCP